MGEKWVMEDREVITEVWYPEDLVAVCEKGTKLDGKDWLKLGWELENVNMQFFFIIICWSLQCFYHGWLQINLAVWPNNCQLESIMGKITSLSRFINKNFETPIHTLFYLSRSHHTKQALTATTAASMLSSDSSSQTKTKCITLSHIHPDTQQLRSYTLIFNYSSFQQLFCTVDCIQS